MVQDGEQRAADDKQGEAEQRLVRAYVEGIDEAATYRRVVLDGYLDRREAERARCEEGEERYNVCIRADGEEIEEEEIEKEIEEEIEEEMEEMKEEMEEEMEEKIEEEMEEGGSSNEEEAETLEREQEEAQQAFN
ncbi:hypothetical protein PTNB85_10182 [Pyrenophora teres f. teres]|nr:hypothetical protein PTNB85_10182 [Pyrenophora teres f. teres]